MGWLSNPSYWISPFLHHRIPRVPCPSLKRRRVRLPPRLGCGGKYWGLFLERPSAEGWNVSKPSIEGSNWTAMWTVRSLFFPRLKRISLWKTSSPPPPPKCHQPYSKTIHVWVDTARQELIHCPTFCERSFCESSLANSRLRGKKRDNGPYANMKKQKNRAAFPSKDQRHSSQAPTLPSLYSRRLVED